ncbi:MAG: hypothetical protein JRI97_08200 [Deltaproteobacteria bacterium]|nr:hypothetical protein [Deltaproteobacteria bacterium]
MSRKFLEVCGGLFLLAATVWLILCIVSLPGMMRSASLYFDQANRLMAQTGRVMERVSANQEKMAGYVSATRVITAESTIAFLAALLEKKNVLGGEEAKNLIGQSMDNLETVSPRLALLGRRAADYRDQLLTEDSTLLSEVAAAPPAGEAPQAVVDYEALNAMALSDLKSAYSAAMAFFAENPDQEATLDKVALFGFSPTEGVTVEIGPGTKDALVIRSSHTLGNLVYAIGPEGELSSEAK